MNTTHVSNVVRHEEAKDKERGINSAAGIAAAA
jgi:hypothetical protein